MEQETRKEFGKLLIDIAKYIITAIIVSTFFKTFEESWVLFVSGGVLAMALLVYGFWMFNRSIKK